MTTGTLVRLSTPELDRFAGYLDAARHVLVRGQLDVTLDVALFEIVGGPVDDEDVIRAAYPSGFNPIEYREERSFDELASSVHRILRITREFWKPECTVPDRIEDNLREGYWKHVAACFDRTGARIVALGGHVPYMNIGGGFTYILYTPDGSKCLLLMGNTTD